MVIITMSLLPTPAKYTEDPGTWDPDLPYHLKSSEQCYAEDKALRAGKSPVQGEQGEESGPVDISLAPNFGGLGVTRATSGD